MKEAPYWNNMKQFLRYNKYERNTWFATYPSAPEKAPERYTQETRNICYVHGNTMEYPTGRRKIFLPSPF